MKILHYTHNLGSGGAEKLLSDILPLMKQQGHEVHLALSNSKKNVDSFQDKLVKSGIPIFDFNTSFYNPFQVLKLIWLIRREKYDIIHAHLFPTQYWVAFASIFKRSNTKLIKTEHSVFNERRQYPFLKPFEKLVYSSYNKIIGITTQVSDSLAKWIDSDKKIVTILNGVNLDQINLAHQNINLEEYTFLKSDNFNILMVGRFDGWQKDQLSLIEALNYLPEEVSLYFAGEGPSLENVKTTVRILNYSNRIHFLGMRTDVYKLMHLSDLNVLSTNHEGLSGVALESLASGKPFIGSDVVGVNNVVPDNNYLFSKQNPKELANKIIEIIENKELQDDLVIKARTHVRKFDIKNMSNEYLNLYSEILK